MAKNRLEYGVILLFSATFYLFFLGYLSFYVFWAVVLFPLFSLICSLPCMLCAKVSLQLEKSAVRKGEETTLKLTASLPVFLPGGRVRLRVSVQNLLTGEKEEETCFLTSGAAEALSHTLSSRYCGKLLCRVEEFRVYDYLGLFSFRRRLRSEAAAFCFPRAVPASLTLLPNPAADPPDGHYSPDTPGDDPSELFGIREYREGDWLSRIHWKLSEKAGTLLYKEMSLPLPEEVLLLLDLSGDPERQDCLMDALASLLSSLSKEGRPCRIWYREKQGAVREKPVSKGSLSPLWKDLLSTEFFSQGPLFSGDISFTPGTSHALLLSCQNPASSLGTLRQLLPEARLAALTALPSVQESQESVFFLSRDNLGKVLKALTL